jgi:hypothetical protein
MMQLHTMRGTISQAGFIHDGLQQLQTMNPTTFYQVLYCYLKYRSNPNSSKEQVQREIVNGMQDQQLNGLPSTDQQTRFLINSILQKPASETSESM